MVAMSCIEAVDHVKLLSRHVYGFSYRFSQEEMMTSKREDLNNLQLHNSNRKLRK